MNRHIIFLDIDGVLNNDSCMRLRESYADVTCIEFLIDAIKQIDDIALVISSSWRTSTLERFIEKIHTYNSSELGKLMEFFHIDWCTKKLHNQIRGKEIDEWLSRHPEVEKFICIDDATDFLEDQPLLQTDLIHGFGNQEAIILRMFFNGVDIKSQSWITERTHQQIDILNGRLNFMKKYL